MKISLITISPTGVDWKTMRNGTIVVGHIKPSVPRDEKGNYIYVGSKFPPEFSSDGCPFSDLSEFFNATPKLERFFRSLIEKELSQGWFGMKLLPPSVAVHMVEYSRPIHLGEKMILKDCILHWGARNAITCELPTRYSDSQIHEILTGAFFKKERNLHV
jgi:hypothetical protein